MTEPTRAEAWLLFRGVNSGKVVAMHRLPFEEPLVEPHMEVFPEFATRVAVPRRRV